MALEMLEPDVVVVKPCGFKLEQTIDECNTLRTVLPWDQWPAIQYGRVYLVDGNAYFNRPGLRIVDSTELLAACLYPEALPDLVERYASSITRMDSAGNLCPLII